MSPARRPGVPHAREPPPQAPSTHRAAEPDQLTLWPSYTPVPPPTSGRPPRTTRLLTQSNRRLKRIGVWTWTLPAWAGRLPDGRTYNTCPSAGVCHQVCYALSARNCVK
nr:hypothetical protein [Actinoplanes humidus]